MPTPHGRKIRATFKPKSVADLKERVDELTNYVFEFDYAGTGGADEPFPGQRRWAFARKHDALLEGYGVAGMWAPEEDLQYIEAI